MSSTIVAVNHDHLRTHDQHDVSQRCLWLLVAPLRSTKRFSKGVCGRAQLEPLSCACSLPPVPLTLQSASQSPGCSINTLLHGGVSGLTLPSRLSMQLQLSARYVRVPLHYSQVDSQAAVQFRNMFFEVTPSTPRERLKSMPFFLPKFCLHRPTFHVRYREVGWLVCGGESSGWNPVPQNR
jgi:hypothetical protein